MTPRFIGAMLNSPNQFSLYGASVSDAMGIDSVAKYETFYITEYNKWKEENAPWYSWIPPFTIGAVVYEVSVNDIADGYKEGVNWVENLDHTWQELIGARETTLAKVGCECDYYDYGNYVNSQIYYGVEDCDELEEEDIICSNYYEMIINQKRSDGFILEESAIDAPGLNYFPPNFMDGSNHLQMKNDDNMRIAVDAIFIDGLGRTYFQTDER